MEALSGVASGMAVASLSIQLVQSVGNIKTFIRDVKGVSKELERLAALLDRLGALLEDVRALMERQTSLQAQHFPAPSMTIFDCLRSCEASLQLLQDIMEKYKSSRGNVSAMAKLKDDIRFGLKTKDIAGFEARIQRDIDCLHAALGVNTTNVLMAILPVIVQNPRTSTTMQAETTQCTALTRAPNSSGQYPDMLISSTSSQPQVRTRQARVSSWLERFGVYQWESEQYIHPNQNKRCTRDGDACTTISKSRDVRIAWRVLKVGLHWTRQYPYGRIPSSLSMYPVVEDLMNMVGDFPQYPHFMYQASIQKIQQLFASGAIHPFTSDLRDVSLLHVAAQCGRTDVCDLLFQYGLKYEHTIDVRNPLLAYHIFAFPALPDAEHIDLIRLFSRHNSRLLEFEKRDVFGMSMFRLIFSCITFDVAEWLWINVLAPLGGLEMFSIWLIMLMRTIRVPSKPFKHDPWESPNAIEKIIKMASPEMIKYYPLGEFSLLEFLFSCEQQQSDSTSVGGAFLDALMRLGLDVEACIAIELKHLPSGFLLRNNRRVVFEPLDGGGWRLSWEWAFDPQVAGFLLVSEHIGLGPDTHEYHFHQWPFSEDQLRWWPDTALYINTRKAKEYRFNRRMATKARKERARLGQKRPRSRMPGNWNW